MAEEPEFVAHVRDLLAPLAVGADALRIRRMFGGHGVFLGDTMFALIADDTLYLKADARSRGDFETAGAEPFTYQRSGRLVQLSYYTTPDGAIEHAEALQPWAERAIAAARRNRKR